MTRPRGSERRESAPVRKIVLADAFEDLKREETWKTRPRNAVTLLNAAGLRLVLVGLHEGAAVEPHRAESPISIHLLRGAVRVDAGGEEVALAPGEVVTMAPNVEHAVRADEESAFLLTVGGA